MTQLKEAFQVAGIVSPADRLKKIAIQAMREHAHSRDSACEAIFEDVRRDLTLFSLLMEPYRDMALRKLLIDTARGSQEYDKARGAGPIWGENHEKPAQSERAGGGGQDHCDNRERCTSPRQRFDAGVDARRAAQAAVSTKLMKSLLDTIEVEGRPIGDWQAGEARAWARRNGRMIHFVEMLTANMPPDDLIRKWIQPEMAAEYWQRSHQISVSDA